MMRNRLEVTSPRAPWRAVYAGPLVALGALALAFAVCTIAGVPLRDPDGVAGGRLLVAVGLVGALVLIDVAIRATQRSSGRRPDRDEILAVARERWNGKRLVPLFMALFAFFVTYFAYRNLKSVVPLIRPHELFDRQLTDLDVGLFGEQPGALLHRLLGTGVAAQFLSAGYMLLFIFIPVTLAAALVFSTQLEAGLFYATALSLNWVVGAASYYLLPSIGPFHVDPGIFAALPHTGVAQLQQWLLSERASFLADPHAAGAAQGVGAFASLHVSIFVTGALTAHLLGLRRAIKVTLWVLTAITTLSTIYFGWHYILDDLAGAVIAVMALAFARALTGFRLSDARSEVPALATVKHT